MRRYLAECVMRFHTSSGLPFLWIKHSRLYRHVWNWSFTWLCSHSWAADPREVQREHRRREKGL